MLETKTANSTASDVRGHQANASTKATSTNGLKGLWAGKQKSADAKRKGKPAGKKGVTLPTRPPMAFAILDLTSKLPDAKIIKVSQIIVHPDGEKELSEHLFSNGDTPISAEATQYHGITAADLVGKPDVSTFDFSVARHLVVWDGKVIYRALKNNGVEKIPSIINMHALARYLEDEPKPIRLIDYALKANPTATHTLAFRLKKAENKIGIMISVYNFIKDEYEKKYKLNSNSFLTLVGRSKNKAAFNASVENFLKNHKPAPKKIKVVANDTAEIGSNGKKVIAVKINATAKVAKPRRWRGVQKKT